MNLDTKKGDRIQKRQEISAGNAIMHGFSTMDKARAAMVNVYQHYNLPQGTLLGCEVDKINPGMYAVIVQEDTYVMIDATVMWVVDFEMGVQYADSGASAILDIKDEEGWTVIESVSPVYQSGVEHMSDEELRASIEELRSNRVARPSVIHKKSAGVSKAPPMSKEDKALQKVLDGMSPDERLELQKKLGLV